MVVTEQVAELHGVERRDGTPAVGRAVAEVPGVEHGGLVGPDAEPDAGRLASLHHVVAEQQVGAGQAGREHLAAVAEHRAEVGLRRLGRHHERRPLVGAAGDQPPDPGVGEAEPFPAVHRQRGRGVPASRTTCCPARRRKDGSSGPSVTTQRAPASASCQCRLCLTTARVARRDHDGVVGDHPPALQVGADPGQLGVDGERAPGARAATGGLEQHPVDQLRPVVRRAQQPLRVGAELVVVQRRPDQQQRQTLRCAPDTDPVVRGEQVEREVVGGGGLPPHRPATDQELVATGRRGRAAETEPVDLQPEPRPLPVDLAADHVALGAELDRSSQRRAGVQHDLVADHLHPQEPGLADEVALEGAACPHQQPKPGRLPRPAARSRRGPGAARRLSRSGHGARAGRPGSAHRPGGRPAATRCPARGPPAALARSPSRRPGRRARRRGPGRSPGRAER